MGREAGACNGNPPPLLFSGLGSVVQVSVKQAFPPSLQRIGRLPFGGSISENGESGEAKDTDGEEERQLSMQPGALPRSTGLLAGQYPLAITGIPTNPCPFQGLSHPICQMGPTIPTPPSSSKPTAPWKERLC